LVSQVCLWRVTTRPDVICKDLSSGTFAAFFGSKVCLFRLPSPEPIFVAVNSDSKRVIAATFANELKENDDDKRELAPLYFITVNQKLMCLRNKTMEINEEDEISAEIGSTSRTPFGQLLAASKASKRTAVSSGRSQINYETNMQLLSGATHTLPSVATIGPRFAESCLAKKETHRQDEIIFPDLSSEITFASLRITYSK